MTDAFDATPPTCTGCPADEPHRAPCPLARSLNGNWILDVFKPLPPDEEEAVVNIRGDVDREESEA